MEAKHTTILAPTVGIVHVDVKSPQGRNNLWEFALPFRHEFRIFGAKTVPKPTIDVVEKEAHHNVGENSDPERNGEGCTGETIALPRCVAVLHARHLAMPAQQGAHPRQPQCRALAPAGQRGPKF